MSVAQAQLTVSSSEFTEWQAYFRLEPFGEQIADLRHGVLCALLANLKRDTSVRPAPFKPADFIYWAKAAQDVDEEDDDGVLLEDPVAQSNLIRAAVFGRTLA